MSDQSSFLVFWSLLRVQSFLWSNLYLFCLYNYLCKLTRTHLSLRVVKPPVGFPLRMMCGLKTMLPALHPHPKQLHCRNAYSPAQHLQLAALFRRDLPEAASADLFDPVLSAVECAAAAAFGFSISSLDDGTTMLMPISEWKSMACNRI
jgi:hypothetical protein